MSCSGEWDPHEVGLGGTRMSGSCEWVSLIRWGAGWDPSQVGQGQVLVSGTSMRWGWVGPAYHVFASRTCMLGWGAGWDPCQVGQGQVLVSGTRMRWGWVGRAYQDLASGTRMLGVGLGWDPHVRWGRGCAAGPACHLWFLVPPFR